MDRFGDIRAVLFDKDGTLFDFHATWGGWSAQLIANLADGDGALMQRLAAALGYDAEVQRFDPASPVIAGTPEDVLGLLVPILPEVPREALLMRINALAADVAPVPAVPLAPLLAALRGRGLRLGVATNDAEVPARAHLDAAGVLEAFDFIAGFDSGFGAKPGPGMLLAFAQSQGVAAERTVMVGDSTHDLAAGRAAGMVTVGVLSGPAGHAELAPLADAVLPDIGALPALLSG